jgi:hypothetical protein
MIQKKILFTRSNLFCFDTNKNYCEEAIDLQNKLLKNNDENHFKMIPQKLHSKETLILNDRTFTGLDVFKNINNIPILLFSLKNKIYLMNMITRKNIKEIIVDVVEEKIKFLNILFLIKRNILYVK